QQRRGQNLLAMRYGGEYSYYTGSNQLEKVMGSMSIDDSGNKRDMSAGNNFLYDRDGNMVEDKSKQMTISYDHRGLPVEFKREVPSISGVAGEKDSVQLTLAYDGAGSRITKKRERKVSGGEWTTELATHYTGIGSEIREDAINNATKVVVNLPQGLGRYDIEDASNQYVGIDPEHLAGYIPSAKFEWYLKNHLGSTMLVYGTQSYDDLMKPNFVGLKSAYDYRAFGEQVDLTILFNDKVTETFTGKELDDETELSYFGARYLDQMLGMWVSVDAKRQHYSPYVYGSNNPIVRIDPDGNTDMLGVANDIGLETFFKHVKHDINTVNETAWKGTIAYLDGIAKIGEIGLKATSVFVPDPRIRNAANLVLIGSDILDGYAKNGAKGVGIALGVDITVTVLSKRLPDNLVSRFSQAIAFDFVLEAGQEMLSNNNININTTESELIIKNPQVPADNTSVKGN
ncbi:MAG TPA: RHS repeat-associated core domain-containing protein, partial [Lachnospiraceae bacterium]|nr:RHS repeat-associated core domain-containing protein [Lachnospiraceae bacterium]